MAVDIRSIYREIMAGDLLYEELKDKEISVPFLVWGKDGKDYLCFYTYSFGDSNYLGSEIFVNDLFYINIQNHSDIKRFVPSLGQSEKQLKVFNSNKGYYNLSQSKDVYLYRLFEFAEMMYSGSDKLKSLVIENYADVITGMTPTSLVPLTIYLGQGYFEWLNKILITKEF